MTCKLIILWFILALLFGCGSRDYFRTQITSTPCVSRIEADCSLANLTINEQDDYALAFVEFNDHGDFYDARQADSVVQWLRNIKQPQYVVLYTHGWHHNAKDSDNNVRRFKESLRGIKQRNQRYQVLGIYLGWRGETLETPGLRVLTFWNRKAVSETLGRGQFREFLLQIDKQVKANTNSDNRLLTIGHSLGAMVILNALQADWLARIAQQGPGIGDLVLLVNPAIEASRFLQLRTTVQHLHEHQEIIANNASLMIVGSEADDLTKSAFTWSRVLPALFESQTNTSLSKEFAQSSSWELETTAIGHYQKFLTHRLEATPALNNHDTQCPDLQDYGPNLVSHTTLISNTDHEITSWLEEPGLRLKRLPTEFANGPLWFLQTDKNVLPNHGFMTQNAFWCFIEHSIRSPSQGNHDHLKPKSAALSSKQTENLVLIKAD